MLTTMMEQRAKEVKNCNKDNFKKIKQELNSPSSNVKEAAIQILDRICRIVQNNPDAKYSVEGMDIFQNETAFSSAIKKCDPAKYDKQMLKELRNEVNNNSEGKPGAILALVLNPAVAEKMQHFYPYFKVLFRMVQIGLTSRRKTVLDMKQLTNDKQIEAINVDIAALQAQIDNLNFHERMTGEVARGQADELASLEHKKEVQREQIAELMVWEQNPDSKKAQYFDL